MSIYSRFILTVFALHSAVATLVAQAPSPASSDSPYSDQKFAPYDQPEWYETPALWIGLVLLILALVLLRIKKKRERYT